MDNNKTKKFQEYQEKRYYEITKQAELNNVIDIQFINMINYFKTHEVVLMQKLDKNIFDYIYYNYDNIKLFLDINRFGVDVIYSLSYYGRRFIKENKIVGGEIMKYKIIRNILKNGDICELKTWDGKIIFGFYMDEHLYRDQENNVVVQYSGFEEQVIAIRRPQSLRNAFDCFKNADLYNYDYNKYGKFDTVYSE